MENANESMLKRDDKCGDPNQKPTSKLRRYSPQILAAMARSLITLNTGLFEGFPSLMIPALIGLGRELDSGETLHVTPAQASWIASFAYCAHPLGAFASCIFNDRFGRKKTFLLATIPFIINWSLLSIGNSVPLINAAFLMMGFGFGLKEASSMTYIGEISETSIRGILLATAGLFASMGNFFTYTLGAFFSWRNVARICATVPIVIFTAIFFIPETPIWLMSNQRPKSALTSLQWLRGCVSPETVQDEYQNLKKYSAKATSCEKCTKQELECGHTESFIDKLKRIGHKIILKPLFLVSALQFFFKFCLVNASRSYLLQILNAYSLKWNSNFTAVVISSFGFFGRMALLPALKVMGKRKIYLLSSLLTSLCCFGLGVIGFTFFPSGWTSFQASKVQNANSTIATEYIHTYSYVTLALILIIQFVVCVGVGTITFILMGEVFPFKHRSILCSIVTSNRYIFAAISSKLYYNIETWFGLSGANTFYGFISLTGFVVMYLILPETEGKSLQEIEQHYSDNDKGLTDIKIKRINKLDEA